VAPVVHNPVMVREVVEALGIRPGGSYIDCTVGEGGHAEAILAAAEQAPRLLGLDLDEDSLATARRRLEKHLDKVTLVRGSYAGLERFAVDNGFMGADGILFDLGFSSAQLDRPARGFSFAGEGPLDMRFDTRQKLTAERLVNTMSERELADLIYKLGEEHRSRRIARAIVAARPLTTTTQLADVVARAAGGHGHGRIHPATRTFQAIRIAVNAELGNIEAGLAQAVQVLAGGGRLVVLSYHSLEDRLVKEFMRRESTGCLCGPSAPPCTCGHTATLRLVSRKVVKPTEEEVRTNPRSRSAKIRVAERTLGATRKKVTERITW